MCLICVNQAWSEALLGLPEGRRTGAWERIPNSLTEVEPAAERYAPVIREDMAGQAYFHPAAKELFDRMRARTYPRASAGDWLEYAKVSNETLTGMLQRLSATRPQSDSLREECAILSDLLRLPLLQRVLVVAALYAVSVPVVQGEWDFPLGVLHD